MIVQDFLRYRRRFRVGITPISSEAFPKLTGWSQNLVHETDLYQSIIPYLEGQNADGAVFSLTGERLTETLSVSEGHSHDTEKTAISWWPIGNWQCPANRGDIKEAATLTANSVYLSPVLCVILGTVQSGTTRVAVRACMTGPFNAGTANFFQLQYSIHGDLDTTFVDGIPGNLVWDLSADHEQAWRESAPIDISGLSFSADRILVCSVLWNFDVSSGSPDVAVYQVQIGALDQ